MVEQGTHKPLVGGSNPPSATTPLDELASAVARGTTALAIPDDATLLLAVSGGPDSIALLLLSAATRPHLVEAATVDHGLRAESASEAAMVAELL